MYFLLQAEARFSRRQTISKSIGMIKTRRNAVRFFFAQQATDFNISPSMLPHHPTIPRQPMIISMDHRVGRAAVSSPQKIRKPPDFTCGN